MNIDYIVKIIVSTHESTLKCARNESYRFKGHRWSLSLSSSHCNLPIFGEEDITIYAEKILDGGQHGSVLYSILYRLEHIIYSYKGEINRRCIGILYDSEFREKLDTNINLIGFNNGVYDLESEIFRSGCPEDCISMSTGYDFVPLDKANGYYEDIKHFFRTVQPDKNVRSYVLALMSTCLSGSQASDSCYIFKSKASGTSTMFYLLYQTFGEYMKSIDESVINSKSKPYAQLDVVYMKSVRIGNFSVNGIDKIDTTLFEKMLQGKIECRRLPGKMFRSQMKPFLQCYRLPKISSVRNPKVQPVLIIQPARFVTHTDRTTLKENEHYRIPNFHERMDDWKQTFAAMLIKKYAKYKKIGLVVPESVAIATANYLDFAYRSE